MIAHKLLLCRVPSRPTQLLTLSSLPNSLKNIHHTPLWDTRPTTVGKKYESREYAQNIASEAQPARNMKWFIIFPVIAFGLGTWQILRMQWKQNLIDNATEKISQPVAELPDDISESNISQYEFRRVSCTGTYMKGLAMPIGPRANEGRNGFYLVAPFRLANGKTILVNRGWVPKESLKSYISKEITGETEVVGFMKKPIEKHSSLTPQNKPEINEWYYLDGPTMASYVGALPIVINAISENPNQDTKIVRFTPDVESMFFNKHLSYVATWYSLSACLAGFTWYLLRHPPRG